MTETLPSLIAGEWRTGTGDGVTVNDAVTGESIVRVTSTGLDLSESVDHARTIGGPALRELNFHERAALVKALALALSERKQELYDLSARAGCTRADAKVDIDGGFGTALVFASLARKGLPESDFVVEGDIEQLSRGGTFVGQHVLTSRRGVALQINAYNFPVWGILEKLAPALIAGMPTIIKPATPTAYIAEHAVRIINESGVLPQGALQLISGSVPGIFDLLGGQDAVGFTGSANTAAKLRSHPAVTDRSLRFTAEADSLNTSVLGPDATAHTPEFDLFVDSLITEMTVKAGQKCTAVRRAFVPRERLDEVTEAVASKLSKVVVGAPGAEGVTMGALVGLDQREDVRHAVGRLAAEADIVFGDPTKVDVVDADDSSGAFMSPVLLRAKDGAAQAPHVVEAFGPVCTLIPFDGVPDLLGLMARGEGSLAGSVVTHDADFAREVVLSSAAFHGRMLVLDREDADESTGHGTPMPQLVHGGPGRAGGGEEEGGLRAVHHHLQRTALQAGPDMLRAMIGS